MADGNDTAPAELHKAAAAALRAAAAALEACAPNAPAALRKADAAICKANAALGACKPDNPAEVYKALAELEARDTRSALWGVQGALLWAELSPQQRLWLASRMHRVLVGDEPPRAVFSLSDSRLEAREVGLRLRAIALEQLRNGYAVKDAAESLARTGQLGVGARTLQRNAGKYRTELDRMRATMFVVARGALAGEALETRTLNGGRPLVPPELAEKVRRMPRNAPKPMPKRERESLMRAVRTARRRGSPSDPLANPR